MTSTANRPSGESPFSCILPAGVHHRVSLGTNWSRLVEYGTRAGICGNLGKLRSRNISKSKD